MKSRRSLRQTEPMPMRGASSYSDGIMIVVAGKRSRSDRQNRQSLQMTSEPSLKPWR